MRTSHYGELNSMYEREETRGGRSFLLPSSLSLCALIYSLVFVALIEFVTGEKHFSLSLFSSTVTVQRSLHEDNTLLALPSFVYRRYSTSCSTDDITFYRSRSSIEENIDIIRKPQQ